MKQHVNSKCNGMHPLTPPLEQALRNAEYYHSISAAAENEFSNLKTREFRREIGKVILAKGQVTTRTVSPVIGANILLKGRL